MDSESKHKLMKNDNIDLISDMPDSILCKILSYVPTKNAVGTSILSTRWKNLFPIFVPPVKLEFDDSLLLHPQENIPNSVASNFIDFVDRILKETLVDGPSVETMTLNCRNIYGDDKINSWVSYALQLKLQELKLKVFLYDSEGLFRSLSGCLTLVRLKIGDKFLLRVPKGISFCLPNLKELCLANLIFDDDDDDNDEDGEGSIHRLFYGCRALEDLCIRRCEFGNTRRLCIESNVLKKLTIQDSWNDTKCELEINTPNLETLFYSDFAAKNYNDHKFLCLLDAHIDMRPPNQQVIDEIIEEGSDEEDIESVYHTAVDNIITACSTVVHLYISAPFMEVLYLSYMDLPRFEILTCLSFGCIGLDEWTVLARFLQNAPNLERLTLQEGFSEPSGGFAKFRIHAPHRPCSLGLKLKEIDYWAFKNEDDEIKLLKYFLYQGQCLEIIKLHWLPYEDLGNLSELYTLSRNYDCHYSKTDNGMQISIHRDD